MDWRLRNRVVSGINLGVWVAKKEGCLTATQLKFLDGAQTLDTYSPDYFITASGGRELPAKYFKSYGLVKPKRKASNQ